MMHDKRSSSVPEVSVSGALVHPSIVQVASVAGGVFSFGTFALKSGHQSRLFPGESATLQRKHPHLPAVCATC